MSLTRRGLAGGVASLVVAGQALAAGPADLTLVMMGDLHSGYRWSSRLLAAVRTAVASARGAVLVVINGDVFEHNNVVARRTGGTIDLALVRGLSELAPVLVTIGNHDSDLVDPAVFVAQIGRQGGVVLSDIVDPRTGRGYGAASYRLRVGGKSVVFAALGTPALGLYPTAYRGLYQVPDPTSYAATRLPGLFGDADLAVALVHAGFQADRSVLPLLPEVALLHGAHDHLRFVQATGRRLHLQSGAWSSAFQLVDVRFGRHGPAMTARDVVLDEASPQDAGLQTMIDTAMRQALEPADRVVVGRLDTALDLRAAVRRTAEQAKRAADADLALLGHTSFGDGLPAGVVTAYDVSGFMRFDGGLSVGEVGQDRLAGLLARLDQADGGTGYDRRTGDYLHASDLGALPRHRPLKVVTNSWTVASADNRRDYYGWDIGGFAPVPELPKLGQIVGAMLD